MTAALPVLARVLPPGCTMPGCAHHYWRADPGDSCACVTWPAECGIHVYAVNPLCQHHHTVMDLIEDAAANLEMQGYLDPDEDEIPPHVVALLLELYQAGECGLCPRWPSPDSLAEHLLARWQREWEQSIPAWACECGAVYKLLFPYGGNQEEFHEVAEDDTLGDLVGGIKRNSKGKAVESDTCPACGERFADTIDRQINPQQSLF